MLRSLNERHAERVGIVAEAVGLRAAALLGDPHGVALAADQFGERIAELDGFVRAVGDDEFGFQPAFVVDPQEADDGSCGLILQQIERDADHFVGMIGRSRAI